MEVDNVEVVLVPVVFTRFHKHNAFFSRSQKCKEHQSAPDEEVEDVIVMVVVVTEVVLEDAVVEDVLVLEDVVVVVVPQAHQPKSE